MRRDTLTKLTHKTKKQVNIEEEAKEKCDQLGDCIYKEMPFSDHLIILFKVTEKYCSGKDTLKLSICLRKQSTNYFPCV